VASERIAVLGAGIGGLTTALALAHRGLQCVVFEQSPTLPVAGGGIQIPPNAARVLHKLGLAPALDAAVRPEAIELKRWRDGSVLGRVDLGATALARYGVPYYAIRRAELCRALFEAVRRQCGTQTVQFGRRCVAVTEDAELTFADGTGVHADIVIGADGIHSLVGAHLGAGALRYSGHAVYRAVVPADRVPGPARVRVWLGPGQHCVSYPVDGDLVNLVAMVPAPVPPPGGMTEGDREEVLTAYRGWDPEVRGLLAVAGRLDHHGLFDRPAPRRRHRAGLAVIGDAAHPMLPFLAQGAAQAIEDAALLAGCVREPGGLARYATARQARVTPIAAAARAGALLHHLPDGAEQRLRDRRLAGWRLPDQDWLFAHDGRTS
jgi:salicylate hydroxylase